MFSFFFQAEDGIRDRDVTGVQTCALPISRIAVVNGCNLPALLLKSYHPDFTFNQGNHRPCKWVNEWSELYSSKYYRRADRKSVV